MVADKKSFKTASFLVIPYGKNHPSGTSVCRISKTEKMDIALAVDILDDINYFGSYPGARTNPFPSTSPNSFCSKTIKNHQSRIFHGYHPLLGLIVVDVNYDDCKLLRYKYNIYSHLSIIMSGDCFFGSC